MSRDKVYLIITSRGTMLWIAICKDRQDRWCMLSPSPSPKKHLVHCTIHHGISRYSNFLVIPWALQNVFLGSLIVAQSRQTVHLQQPMKQYIAERSRNKTEKYVASFCSVVLFSIKRTLFNKRLVLLLLPDLKPQEQSFVWFSLLIDYVSSINKIA